MDLRPETNENDSIEKLLLCGTGTQYLAFRSHRDFAYKGNRLLSDIVNPIGHFNKHLGNYEEKKQGNIN